MGMHHRRRRSSTDTTVQGHFRVLPSEGKREYGDVQLHRLRNLLERVKNRNEEERYD
jgi:hypothetical protein